MLACSRMLAKTIRHPSFSIACRCNIVLFSSLSTPNDSNESSFPLFLRRMTRMVLYVHNIKPGKSQRPDTSPGGRSLFLYMNHIAICCPLGYGFCTVLVCKTGNLYTLPIWIWNGLCFFKGTTRVYKRICPFNCK